MSKGTPRYTIRIPDDLADDVHNLILRRNDHSSRKPWDFTGFILHAIQEKLDKHERGRKRKRENSAEERP